MNFKNYRHLIQVLLLVKTPFFNDWTQLHLIFQPIYKTITTFSGIIDPISEWESKGLSNEKFMCAYTANVGVYSKLIWMNIFKIILKFKGSCLKQ